MRALNEVIQTSELTLQDTNLVEASAGTGKTHSIQTLFLRLVVEHGFDLRRILVVTFTEAATKELRDRLRGILHKTRLLLDDRLPADDGDRERIEAVLDLPLRSGDDDTPDDPGDRVRRALLDIDEASVFTIHGFCNRVLSRHAFECGHDGDAELTTDKEALVTELCGDWWRRHMYTASPTLLASAEAGILTFDRLRRLAKKRIGTPDAVLKPGPITAEALGKSLAQACPLLGGLLVRYDAEQCGDENAHGRRTQPTLAFCEHMEQLRPLLNASKDEMFLPALTDFRSFLRSKNAGNVTIRDSISQAFVIV